MFAIHLAHNLHVRANRYGTASYATAASRLAALTLTLRGPQDLRLKLAFGFTTGTATRPQPVRECNTAVRTLASSLYTGAIACEKGMKIDHSLVKLDFGQGLTDQALFDKAAAIRTQVWLLASAERDQSRRMCGVKRTWNYMHVTLYIKA